METNGVTKSSEGNMTAKEAICKNCGHGRNGHVDKWGGICVGCPCPGFELVNAAESLPAEPEQKLGTCMASFVLHTRGTYCIDWTPVAPVEAKEKCGATFEANMPWRICNLLKGHDSMHQHDGIYWVFDAREPKPTPSAATEQVMAAVNWAMGCSDDDFVKPENAPTYWWRSELAKRAGIIYDGKKYVKPQPDSSSISSEHHIVHAHEMVDMIDKTLSCTSGMSFGECLEEIKRRLGE